MISKANKKIAIFDINDKTKENEYHKIRMADMNEEDYKKKYQGLEHLFYRTFPLFRQETPYLRVKLDFFFLSTFSNLPYLAF